MLKKTKKILTITMMGMLALGNVTVMAEERSDNETTTENYTTAESSEAGEEYNMGSSNGAVSIEEVNVNWEAPELISNIGNISVKKNINVGNISVPLYCTFDSQQEALSAISDNEVIQLLKDEYGFEDISDANWQQYYNAMYEMLDSPECPEWYNEENDELWQLRQFFDIYENEERNDEIIYSINSNARISDVTQNADILLLLPYDSYLTLNQQSSVLNNEQAITTSVIAGFDIDAGISYATTYAESPNEDDYKYFSSDCTNFASQILENGGVAQVVYDSENSGWWHTVSKVLFVTTHDHSISWIRADTFAKYMGVGYTSTSHSAFSSNIQKGDFIGYDESNDGDWNHIGFVTDRNNSPLDGWYNYKVAQHTKNYNAWVSSDTNGWETLESKGVKYGRIRR